MHNWHAEISRVYSGTTERGHGIALAWCMNERGRIQEGCTRGWHGTYTGESGETEEARMMCGREHNDHQGLQRRTTDGPRRAPMETDCATAQASMGCGLGAGWTPGRGTRRPSGGMREELKWGKGGVGGSSSHADTRRCTSARHNVRARHAENGKTGTGAIRKECRRGVRVLNMSAGRE